MKEKEQYSEPTLEVILFEEEDIITASGCGTCYIETYEIP